MRPHAEQPVVTTGAPLGQGAGVVIAVHGRGAGPEDVLGLAPQLGRGDITYLAPAAAGRTWYPYSFMAEIARNEPGLSSALQILRGLVDAAVAAGVPTERIVLAGFSQGACLASEFIARHPGRYGGALIFSGGLIGPPGTTWDHRGTLDGTPIFLGCSDVDAHVPKHRVDESADVFRRMGGRVDERIYPGMGHTINEDELAAARTMLDAL